MLREVRIPSVHNSSFNKGGEWGENEILKKYVEKQESVKSSLNLKSWLVHIYQD